MTTTAFALILFVAVPSVCAALACVLDVTGDDGADRRPNPR